MRSVMFSSVMTMLLLVSEAGYSGQKLKQERIDLRADAFEHIQFGKIQPTQYRFDNGVLIAEVDDSASFLMQAFDAVKTVVAVRFKWQTQGRLLVKNAAHETRRDGDDAVFKLGLLLKTGAALPNPFVPKWLKRVQALLKFPSENMLNLVAGAHHAAGEQWSGPYNSRVKMIAVKSAPDGQGWRQASHQLETPAEVVAIWLMADGDNTHSAFTTRVKAVELDVLAQ